MTACIGCGGATGAKWRKWCPPCWEAKRRARGQFVAVLPGRAPKPAAEPKPPRLCADCGVEIGRARIRCVPCQSVRRNRMRNEARKAVRSDRPCEECGAIFTPLTNRSILCGAECREVRKRRQSAESAKRPVRKVYRRLRKADPDEERGISVEEYLERVRPLWARDPLPPPTHDAWAGCAQWGWVD